MLLCLYYVLMFFCLKKHVNMLLCLYLLLCLFPCVILSTNHLFLVKMRNFPKKYLVVRKLYVNLHRKVRIGVCGR